MITDKTSECEDLGEFLVEAARQAHEIVALRTRLADARREHGQLLEEREQALQEGRDVLPRVRELFLEIEELPPEILRREQGIHWLIDQGVETLNFANRQVAAQQYMKIRDKLRQVLEKFHEELVSVQMNIKAAADLGPSVTDLYNSRLAEIDGILGGAHLPRISYKSLPLPTIDAARVQRGAFLEAIEVWISGLH